MRFIQGMVTTASMNNIILPARSLPERFTEDLNNIVDIDRDMVLNRA